MRSLIISTGLVLSFIMLGCNYSEIKQISTSGDIAIETDENIAPVIKRATNEFMRLNKEAKVTVKTKTTNEVVADLLNGDVKTVISSRDFSKSEKELIEKNKIDIKSNQFALDGLGIIVNPKNELRKASYTELQKIFKGEVTDWKDMDGDNKDVHKGKIKVFIARKNSAVYDFFKDNVLFGADYYKDAKVCSTSTQMLEEIRKDENAIGLVTLGWITKSQDTLDTTVKALKILSVNKDGSQAATEYVGFYQAYVADKTYPLTMPQFIFTRDFSMSLTVGFMTFMLGYDGQKAILTSGLVPVTQPVKIIQLN